MPTGRPGSEAVTDKHSPGPVPGGGLDADRVASNDGVGSQERSYGGGGRCRYPLSPGRGLGRFPYQLLDSSE